jgi:hypothetical protein
MLGHSLPILIAALAAFSISALWYSPLLFAKAWVRVHGYTAEKLTVVQARALRAYAGSFVAYVLMAFVLRLLIRHIGADSIGDGAAWAFHAWLGFALPIGFIANLYSDTPVAAFLIDAGCQLVYMTVMGAILGGWQ